MPEIPAEVQLAEPLFEGLTGTITAAEITKTAVQGFNGVRVEITADNGKKYAEMLWIRGVVGTKSKIGCFMARFGRNTDNWIGRRVHILGWKEKNRAIEELAPITPPEEPAKKKK